MDRYSQLEISFILLSLIYVSGTKVDDLNRQSGLDHCYCLRKVAAGLRSPVAAIFFLDNGKERILVVEQRGLVHKMTINGDVVDTFMDIRDRVVTSQQQGDSRGLLSIVLDPHYDHKKKVYVYYIRKYEKEDYAYVSMFNVESGQVSPKSEKFLLRIYQPFNGGNGGPMFFGDDGYLYIVTGDGGERDDPKGNAQNKNSFYGKVLRIDVTSGQQDFTEKESGVAKLYAIPKTNPFVNDPIARPELYALGIRNMWGCTQDSVNKKGTGRIFCAETGTDKFDEINLIQSGMNYGWNVRQGTACQMSNSAECRPLENEKYPIFEFRHNSSHALVGGYLYRGLLFPHLYGLYTFADAVTGRTYLLEEMHPGKWDKKDWLPCDVSQCPPEARLKALKHVLAFAQDMNSELYILMSDEFLIHSDKGKIFQFLPLKSYKSDMLPGYHLIIAMLLCVSWDINNY